MQGESSISDNQVWGYGRGPWKARWWRQVHPMLKQHFAKTALFENAAVAFPPVCSDVHHRKTISGIAYCHQHEGVITFIVKIITPGMRWCLNIYVFPVEASNAVREVP